MPGPARRARVATISDVAALARVTPAVVSRVLNQDATLRVREDTRERVLRAVEELDYTPNTAARALRLAASGAIGFIEHNVSNPLHAETVRGAQRSADRAGYVVLLADAEALSANEVSYRALLASGRIEGVLLHLGGYDVDESLRRLAESRLPTVVINSQVQTPAGSVVLQDEQAARLATEHLLELGHRRIGLLGALARSAQGARRLRGVRRALAVAGLTLRDDWVLEAGFDEPAGRAAMGRLLQPGPRPTGVVVANVMAAIGALGAAREAGVRIPDELSLVAIQDIWVAEHTAPPLTTVRLPLLELGEVAVDLLLEMIRGGKRRDIVLREPPPGLVRRASTAAPAPPGRPVAGSAVVRRPE